MSSSKSPITCHVLDASTGKPAVGVEIKLQEHQNLEEGMFTFMEIAHGVTGGDGRCTDLLEGGSITVNLKQGLYKMVFRTNEYFEKTGRKSFYPWIEVTFFLEELTSHHHIPLLISPYSYTTYKGT